MYPFDVHVCACACVDVVYICVYMCVCSVSSNLSILDTHAHKFKNAVIAAIDRAHQTTTSNY